MRENRHWRRSPAERRRPVVVGASGAKTRARRLSSDVAAKGCSEPRGVCRCIGRDLLAGEKILSLRPGGREAGCDGAHPQLNQPALSRCGPSALSDQGGQDHPGGMGLRDEQTPCPDPGATATASRWATPTGAPCPRSLGVDGTIVGCADCHGCGYCMLLAEAAWAELGTPG